MKEKETNRNKEIDIDNLPIIEELLDTEDLDFIIKKESMKINESNVDEIMAQDTKLGKPILPRALNKKNYLPVPRFDLVVNLVYRIKEINMKNKIISELQGRIAVLEAQLKKNNIKVDITAEDAKNLNTVIEATATMLVDTMQDVSSTNLLPDKLSNKLSLEINKQVALIKQDVRTTQEYGLIVATQNIKDLQDMIADIKKNPMLMIDEKSKEIRQLMKEISNQQMVVEKLQGRNKTTIENISGDTKDKKSDPIAVTTEAELAEIAEIELEYDKAE